MDEETERASSPVDGGPDETDILVDAEAQQEHGESRWRELRRRYGPASARAGLVGIAVGVAGTLARTNKTARRENLAAYLNGAEDFYRPVTKMGKTTESMPTTMMATGGTNRDSDGGRRIDAASARSKATHKYTREIPPVEVG